MIDKLCRDEIRVAWIRDSMPSARQAGSARSSLKDRADARGGGVKGYDVVSWNACSRRQHAAGGHCKTQRRLRECWHCPTSAESCSDLGIEARAGSPEELKARLVADIAKWTK